MPLTDTGLCKASFEFFRDYLATSPHDYLETGSFTGYYVAKLATLYPHKRFYCVDPFIEDGLTNEQTGKERGEAITEVERRFLAATKDLPNVTLFKMTSAAFLDANHEHLADLNVGSVLIDGSHHYEDVIVDAEIARRLIAGKVAAVFFDDAVKSEDVRAGMNEFAGYLGDRITSWGAGEDSQWFKLDLSGEAAS